MRASSQGKKGDKMSVITNKQFKSGTKVELDGKKYVVVSSIDLKWLKVTKKNLFETFLKEYID
jgi:hypothetical protein